MPTQYEHVMGYPRSHTPRSNVSRQNEPLSREGEDNQWVVHFFSALGSFLGWSVVKLPNELIEAKGIEH